MRWPIVLILVAILFAVACSGNSSEPSSKATAPSSAPFSTTSTTGDQTSVASVEVSTNTDGEALVHDSVANRDITIRVLSVAQEPLANIEVYFATNGLGGLVIAADPEGIYGPGIAFTSYARDAAYHLALAVSREPIIAVRRADSAVVPLLIVVVMAAVSAFEIGQGVGELLIDPPDLLEFTAVDSEWCVTPNQIKTIVGTGIRTLLLVPLEAPTVRGIVMAGLKDVGTVLVERGIIKSVTEARRYTVRHFTFGAGIGLNPLPIQVGPPCDPSHDGTATEPSPMSEDLRETLRRILLGVDPDGYHLVDSGAFPGTASSDIHFYTNEDLGTHSSVLPPTQGAPITIRFVVDAIGGLDTAQWPANEPSNNGDATPARVTNAWNAAGRTLGAVVKYEAEGTSQDMDLLQREPIDVGASIYSSDATAAEAIETHAEAWREFSYVRAGHRFLAGQYSETEITTSFGDGSVWFHWTGVNELGQTEVGDALSFRVANIRFWMYGVSGTDRVDDLKSWAEKMVSAAGGTTVAAPILRVTEFVDGRRCPGDVNQIDFEAIDFIRRALDQARADFGSSYPELYVASVEYGDVTLDGAPEALVTVPLVIGASRFTYDFFIIDQVCRVLLEYLELYSGNVTYSSDGGALLGREAIFDANGGDFGLNFPDRYRFVWSRWDGSGFSFVREKTRSCIDESGEWVGELCASTGE